MNDETSFSLFSLSGGRILITGASSGLGPAVTQSYARMDTELIVTGYDQTRLDGRLTTLQSISELLHRTVQAGLRVAEERAVMVTTVDNEIHGLVYSAGISHLCPVWMMTEAHLHGVQSVNVDSPMLLTQTLLKRNLIAPGGSILFIAPIAAHIGVAGIGAYSETKTTLAAMSRCLAMKVVRRNIQVNCPSPSLVETPLLDAAARTVGSMDGQRGNHPVGFDRPEDITNAAIFMLSGANRWVTGTTLVMDGGLTIS